MNMSTLIEPLPAGTIGLVQSDGFFGRGIRWAQTKWLQRRSYIENDTAWSNHVFIVARVGQLMYACEALERGNVMTNMNEYFALAEQGKVRVKFLYPIRATQADGENAVKEWLDHVEGHEYDFWAYPRLVWKTILGDWESVEGNSILRRIQRWIGRQSAGMETAFYCSEGVAEAWRRAGFDFFHTLNVMPVHFEIAAGWHALKEEYACDVTLRTIGDIA
jgi:hypothetical protein